MGWEFSAVADYLACAVLAATAVGVAWLTVVELSHEAAPPVSEDDRGDLAIW